MGMKAFSSRSTPGQVADTSSVVSPAEYDARAAERIREIIATQHAALRRELESRIAEGYWSGSGQNINPHHVSNALRDLVQSGEMEWVTGQTRGGAQIEMLQPTNRAGRADRIDRAAARKRLLYGRYLGWASGTKRHPKGLIGPAGEAAVRAGILESGAVLPTEPGAGAVARLLGLRLPGPLDSAGVTVPISDDGVPGDPVTLLFEVKNIRQWIYPSAPELYQLLAKGVLVQQARPDATVAPILVCRKAHVTTFYMAKQMGFMVIDMGRQFIGAVEEDKMLEVRNELWFTDLALGDGPSLRVRDRLRSAVRSNCVDVAAIWRDTALDVELGQTILAAGKARDERALNREVHQLRQAAAERGWLGGW
ncbi:hypothetical protein HMPREF0591_1815 [Mycobacterium parascrofulaceum ATCC BAA-614]|uniref:Uncharacterized protein n=1 Tax=Mycobacterium parascrofulaceum ATCC BAA-614 TaxID=525368 RepID=D5P6M1_9MYCO|nr:hypothetical protein HMPREF0591_1815 [Mycobacterium parascrofulaceum ATCC BAA-614]